METIEIPTEEQAASEARTLFLKLLLDPEGFTLLEMARLKKIIANEKCLG